MKRVEGDLGRREPVVPEKPLERREGEPLL